MDNGLYESFKRLEAQGLKKPATAALADFIASFQSKAEIREWVADHLPELAPTRRSRIRHEIYTDLVFPILWDGFLANDPMAFYWLGMADQNLYALYGRELDWDDRLGRRDDRQFFADAHSLAPDNAQISQAYLESLIDCFGYLDHEWPSGILFSVADNDHLVVLDQISTARRLDPAGRFTVRLDQFEARVRAYVRQVQEP